MITEPGVEAAVPGELNRKLIPVSGMATMIMVRIMGHLTDATRGLKSNFASRLTMKKSAAIIRMANGEFS
ncbi:hypothetical protein GCM10011378_30210 [Hymenobacter glacieicola]|uniref:Uncharacterized protein n=1 Tax=Hymenobacter glacieicola TaxID=1562124 RepID=A0ABQ1WZE1_9BACT|nr:hypothetical protein GCM10011378_30210 [Hymenobacter glacieicola]